MRPARARSDNPRSNARSLIARRFGLSLRARTTRVPARLRLSPRGRSRSCGRGSIAAARSSRRPELAGLGPEGRHPRPRRSARTKSLRRVERRSALSQATQPRAKDVVEPLRGFLDTNIDAVRSIDNGRHRGHAQSPVKGRAALGYPRGSSMHGVSGRLLGQTSSRWDDAQEANGSTLGRRGMPMPRPAQRLLLTTFTPRFGGLIGCRLRRYAPVERSARNGRV